MGTHGNSCGVGACEPHGLGCIVCFAEGRRNSTILSLYEIAQALGATPNALIEPDEEALSA